MVVSIPPLKNSSNQREIRWSQWMESIRKDVECASGISKGRWRILKSGIRLHGVEAADKIWMTCCALHNWLLEVDGLDEKREIGVPNDWEGELGDHRNEDILRHVQPFAIQRLITPSETRQYDTSGMGPGNGVDHGNGVELDPDGFEDAIDETNEHDDMQHNVRQLRKLSLNFFRGRLY